MKNTIIQLILVMIAGVFMILGRIMYFKGDNYSACKLFGLSLGLLFISYLLED